MTELLALYGTLMSGERPRPGAPDLREHIQLVGDCVLRGVLYDFGPYPCLVPGEGRVMAELWRIVSNAALSILDDWEEYDPASIESSTYLRMRVPVLEPTCHAWVYMWNRSVDGLTQLSGGDWRGRSQVSEPREG